MAHWLDPFSRQGAALLDRMIDQQAQSIADNIDVRMMTLVVLPPLLLLPLMRRHAPPAASAPAESPVEAVRAPAAVAAPGAAAD
ncbi:MAG: hypothetical protein J0H67_12595 [Rhodospirillales bacterium]|nr:hypothetical protein [Rhodospirillales bacterium]